jgi:uncharacterized protein involved in exopolysaccharide biosynthesis/MinD-like ATPase involved in chromosome partitioning or flagellar assembly
MQDGNVPAIPPSEGSSVPQSGGGAAPPSAGGTARLDLSSIVATLLREKWVILLIAAVVTGGAFAYTYTQSPTYQASSIVGVSQESTVPASNIVGEQAVQQPRDLESEIGVLRNSITLATRVAADLREMGAESETAPFPILVDEETQQPVSEDELARRILDKVEFAPRPDRNMIEIVVTSSDAGEASTIANIYAEKYREFSREKARESVRAAQEFLEERAAEQRKTIRQLEQRWQAFAQENEVVELGEGGEQLAAKYNELKGRRDELAFRLDRERTQLELLRKQLQDVQSRLEGTLVEQQEASELESEIQALEERIAENRAQAATYYAANPELEGDTARIRNEFPELAEIIDRTQNLEAQKQTLTRRLAERASQNQEAGGPPLERLTQLRSQVEEKELVIQQLESQVAALDSQIADYDTKLSGIPGQRLQREQIERRLKQAQAFQEDIRAELQKTRIAEASELGYVEVVQKASVPSAPVRPNTAQNLLLGLLLGLAFGVGVAFLKEATNTRLRQPSDIEDKGYSLLGVVPDMTGEIARSFDGRASVEVDDRQMSTCLMPLLNPWSSVTENYRLIQTNLKSGAGGMPETLLVTSAQQQEGKTVTAVNLALTAALSGQQVLVIDADMRNPSVHTMLGLSRTPGLANMLAQMAGATEPVTEKAAPVDRSNGKKPTTEAFSYWANRTSVQNLHVIPAGITETAPTSLLDSERIHQLIGVSRQHYDLVVIDTPPTGAASDAVVIGTQTDASTVVVSAEGTDSRALDSVMKSLHTAEVRVAGVVLNRFDEEKAGQDGTFNSAYYSREEYDEYQGRAEGVYEEA